MEERPPREASSLPSIVFSRAEETPEEPALFYPEGLDVRWRSWGALAAQAAGGAEALAALGLPAGDRVAFRWRPDPDAVAADLAIQAAGLVSVPAAAPGASAAPSGGPSVEVEHAARLLAPGEPEPGEGRSAARLPAASETGPGLARRSGGRGVPAAAGRPDRSSAGGAWVVDDGRLDPGTVPRQGAVLGQAELLARARDLGERLERAASGAAAVVAAARRSAGAGEREIAVASFDLRASDGRTFLAWALATGAVLFLEPDPRVLAGSVVWARPTLMAGEARSLGELGRRLRSREATRRRPFRRRSRSMLPFGRLRLLLVLGTGRLAVDDIAFWAGRGVAVVRARA